MSDQSKPERPRQVTVAAGLIIGGSLVVVATVFERITGLHTIETRESIQEFLSEPPGDGLGLEVDGVLTILQTLAMVAGGCATAAAILGYQVLQRSKSARIALSVLAVPLFLTGIAAGGFMSSVVAAAAVMLWFQPARDWFDGIARKTPEQTSRSSRVGAAGGGARSETPPPPAPPPPTATPRAFPGFGAPGSSSPVWDPDTRQLPPVDSVARPPRPAAVVWACVIAWASCGLVIAFMAMSVLVLATAPDLVFDEMRRQNPDLTDPTYTDAAIRSATYTAAAITILWSATAIVITVLAYRRVRWAWIGLLVSSILVTVFFLFATSGSFVFVLPLAVSLATIVLLVRPDVRAWYASHGSVSP